MRGINIFKVSFGAFIGVTMLSSSAIAGGFSEGNPYANVEPVTPHPMPPLPLMGAGGYVTANQAYQVELNKTQILRLPSSASAVVIGNPNIADVSVHAADTLFIVGRGFGTTNLIILDAQGHTMMDSEIQVLNKPSATAIRLYNGANRQSYNCTPNCQPSPILGDDPGFIGSNTGDAMPIRSSGARTAIQNNAPAPSSDSASRALKVQPSFQAPPKS